MARLPAPRFLGIYLNDHLAGATAGVELSRRLARSLRESDMRGPLERLADEIVQDRAELLSIMGEFDIAVRRYKVYTGWAAEKVGRLKLNGSFLRRSPLSTLYELEFLRLAVEGKAAAWGTLRAAMADHDDGTTARLDRLATRARRQSHALEDLRMRTAAEVFGQVQ